MTTTLRNLKQDIKGVAFGQIDCNTEVWIAPERKIRVLYVINQLAMGGATTVALNIANYFNRQPNYEVLLVTGPTPPERKDVTHLAHEYGIPTIELPSLLNQINPIVNAKAVLDLRRIIVEGDYDIVHTHTKIAGGVGRIAARLAKPCLVFHHVHGWGSEEGMSTPIRLLHLGVEWLCTKLTDRIIAVSSQDIQKGLANHIGREDQYVLIYNGIDADEFQRPVDEQELRRELGLEPRSKLVGMIGRLEDQKNPLDFIRAAAEVVKSYPNVQFLLIGGGPLQPQCERLIKDLNLDQKLFLLGFRDDVPRILSILTMTALSSLWEGLPIAFLESMCAGKPIVANDVGGARDVVIDGETGFLVPPHRSYEMAERILYLLVNESICNQLGSNAQLRSAHFSNEKMFEQMQELYECLYTDAPRYRNDYSDRSLAPSVKTLY